MAEAFASRMTAELVTCLESDSRDEVVAAAETIIDNCYADYYDAQEKIDLHNPARHSFAQHGGLPVLVQALKRWSPDEDVSTRLCKALGRAIWEEKPLKVIAQSAGAIEAVAEVVRSQRGSATVLRQAFMALGKLSSLIFEYRQVTIDAGAIPFTVDALKQFPHDTGVNCEGMQLCGTLISTAENAKQFNESGGLEAFHAAMSNHINDPAAMWWALRALSYIVQNSDAAGQQRIQKLDFAAIAKEIHRIHNGNLLAERGLDRYMKAVAKQGSSQE